MQQTKWNRSINLDQRLYIDRQNCQRIIELKETHKIIKSNSWSGVKCQGKVLFAKAKKGTEEQISLSIISVEPTGSRAGVGEKRKPKS